MIELFKCTECGAETEWGEELGKNPLCIDCWDKHAGKDNEVSKKVAAGKRAYYKRNKEKVAAGQRAYYKRNKEKVAAGQRAYRERNKEKVVAGQFK